MSSDIGQNWDGGISDFRISGKSYIKENCHNSRTSNDTDMKREPKTKPEKKTWQPWHGKIDDDALSSNCDAIVTFFISD